MAESRKVGGSAGNRGLGRKAGVPNKMTREIKEMILQALTNKGGVEYLEKQADAQPVAFLTLVGKVLPLQLAGDSNNPVQIITRIELIDGDGTD